MAKTETQTENRVAETREALQILSSSGADGLYANTDEIGVTSSKKIEVSAAQKRRLVALGWIESNDGWSVTL